MKIQDFLGLAARPGGTNYFVICSDTLGLLALLPDFLRDIAVQEDQHYHDAENITVEKAKEIEAEARKGPLAGSEHTHFFIYSLQKIPASSVGILLKAVEEAKFARFIFQAQIRTRQINTLMSRCSVVHLPFLNKKAVFTNMRVKHLDAKTAEDLELYDGTLSGTIAALGMKDALVGVRRELKAGPRGISTLYGLDNDGKHPMLDSGAFEPAMQDLLTREEKAYLKRNPTVDRKKILVHLVSQRVGNGR